MRFFFHAASSRSTRALQGSLASSARNLGSPFAPKHLRLYQVRPFVGRSSLHCPSTNPLKTQSMASPQLKISILSSVA